MLNGDGPKELLQILADDQIEYENSLQLLRDIIKRVEQLPEKDLKMESANLASMVNISRTIRLCKVSESVTENGPMCYSDRFPKADHRT